MTKVQNMTHAYRPLALVRVGGDDAFSFLQGQFTNELRQGEGMATYGLWLNQKGKVVADSQVLNLGGNSFYVMSVGSSAMVIQQRLEAYVVADDVTLGDETETAHGLFVTGRRNEETMVGIFGSLPKPGYFLQRDAVLVFRGGRLRADNFEIIGSAEKLAGLRRDFLAHGAMAAESEEVELARIRAGVPAIPVDLGPADLPNEGGLEETAISYTKGCYLGQEVMARLKNLGQVRRRLHVVGGEGAPLPPATPLFQGSRRAGEIRSAAAEGAGFAALAMLSLVGLDAGAGLSLTPDGPTSIKIRNHG